MPRMPLEEVPCRHDHQREDERVGFGEVEGTFDIALRRHAVAELVACDRIEHQGLDHGPDADDRRRAVEHRREYLDGRPVVSIG